MPNKPQSSNQLLAAIAKATEINHPDDNLPKDGPVDDSRSRGGLKTPSVKQPARRRGDRSGTRLIAGHFEPSVARQLRMLAAEEDTTIQALLAEALDLLFVKKGKGKIVSQAK